MKTLLINLSYGNLRIADTPELKASYNLRVLAPVIGMKNLWIEKRLHNLGKNGVNAKEILSGGPSYHVYYHNEELDSKAVICLIGRDYVNWQFLKEVSSLYHNETSEPNRLLREQRESSMQDANSWKRVLDKIQINFDENIM